MQHRAGDPEVEALLRLGRATEFKAPDGTNTRAQLHRCIRGDKERELCRRLTTVFRGGNDAGPKRVAAAAARAEGAADKRTLTHHQLLSRVREKSKIIAARIQEQDQTYEKLAVSLGQTAVQCRQATCNADSDKELPSTSGHNATRLTPMTPLRAVHRWCRLRCRRNS